MGRRLQHLPLFQWESCVHKGMCKQTLLIISMKWCCGEVFMMAPVQLWSTWSHCLLIERVCGGWPCNKWLYYLKVLWVVWPCRATTTLLHTGRSWFGSVKFHTEMVQIVFEKTHNATVGDCELASDTHFSKWHWVKIGWFSVGAWR